MTSSKTNCDHLKWKERFLNEVINMTDSHFSILTKENYSELLQEIKSAKNILGKTTMQYKRLKRFDIIEIVGVEKIIAKSNNDEIRYYLPIDTIYDVTIVYHILINNNFFIFLNIIFTYNIFFLNIK